MIFEWEQSEEKKKGFTAGTRNPFVLKQHSVRLLRPAILRPNDRYIINISAANSKVKVPAAKGV
jgi:hypothetical protein